MPGIFDTLQRSKGNIDDLAGNLIGFLQQQKQRQDEQEFIRRMTKTRRVLGPDSRAALNEPIADTGTMVPGTNIPQVSIPHRVDAAPPTEVQDFKDPNEWSPEDVMFGSRYEPEAMNMFQKIAAARRPQTEIAKTAHTIGTVTTDPITHQIDWRKLFEEPTAVRNPARRTIDDELLQNMDPLKAFEAKERIRAKYAEEKTNAKPGPQTDKDSELEGKVAASQQAIDAVEKNPALMKKMGELIKEGTGGVDLSKLSGQDAVNALVAMIDSEKLNPMERQYLIDYVKAKKDLAQYQTELEARKHKKGGTATTKKTIKGFGAGR
jgi:hypothetical protein